jgi:OOP family OmpA-OmpF porin
MRNFNLLFLVFLINFSFTQEIKNKYSIDFNFGSSLPISNLTENYYVNYFNLVHLGLGSRYMINEKIGLKIDYGFDRFKNDEFKLYSTSLPFKSINNRINIQGILNLGNILQFNDWTNRISLQLHSGLGYSHLIGDSSLILSNQKITIGMLNFILGFNPQIKVNNKFALNLDISLVSNIKQKYNFDFKETAFNKNGLFSNISIGGSYYLGKNKNHLDWYSSNLILIQDTISVVSKIDSIIKPIIYDLDEDGIIDSLDVCPDIFGFVEFDGCPKPDIIFDCNLNQLPSFQFKETKYEIKDIYLPYIDSIYNCMKVNPENTLMIYGYTDEFEYDSLTNGLSQSRALIIKNALIKKGISSKNIYALGENGKKAELPDVEKKIIKHNRLALFEIIQKNQSDIKKLETGEFLKGLFYTVQIGAYKNEIKKNKFNKLGKLLVSKSPDSLIRYSINIYNNFEEANKKMIELKSLSFAKDAFVAAYFKGQRITINEAKRLIEEKGNDILQK